MAFKMKSSPGGPMKRNFGMGASPMRKSALKFGGVAATMAQVGKTVKEGKEENARLEKVNI